VWDQLRPLRIFAVVGVAILLANIFFNKDNATSPALVHLGTVKLTGAALWAAGTLWLRLLSFALLSLVFVKTTEPQRLILSLVHQLHLNYRVAYSTLVGYRMLPLLQTDYRTIRAAQRVRGAGEKRGSWHSWSRARRYTLPLLTGAVRRASRVAIAMDARASGPAEAELSRTHDRGARRLGLPGLGGGADRRVGGRALAARGHQVHRGLRGYRRAGSLFSSLSGD